MKGPTRVVARFGAAVLGLALAAGHVPAAQASALGDDPVGQLDSVSAGREGISLSGWAADVNADGPTYVWVTVDGQGRHLIANKPRPDVARAFPQLTENHGYSATLPAGPGWHRVCAVAGNSGPGSHRPLGCRTVEVPDGSPIGNFEKAFPVEGGLAIQAWSIDPDTTDPVYLWVTVDGVGQHVLADGERSDLALHFPAYGAAHGAKATFEAAPGPRTVCVTAANVGSGQHRLLGCRQVKVGNLVGGSPIGNFEKAEEVEGGVRIQGWALDPDTVDPAYVWVTINGRGRHLVANEDRPDVGAAYGVYGASRGFSATLPAGEGRHRGCGTVANVGLGSHKCLGCREVGTPVANSPSVLSASVGGLTWYESEIFRLTNATRAAYGLRHLAWSGCAAYQADVRGRNLIGTSGLSHASLSPVISSCGPVSVVAENLSRDGSADSPSRVMDAWMASSGHRRNILDARLTHLGVSCVSDGGAMLCSQVFLAAR